MTDRRVAITGIGIISPIGCDAESVWESLADGTSGVGPLSMPSDSFPMNFAGEVRDFTGHVDNFGELEPPVKKAIRKGLKLMCRETQMGVASAQRALADSGLAAGKFDPERCGCNFGAGYMVTEPAEYQAGIKLCSGSGDFDFNRWGNEGMRQVTPLWLLKYLPNMPACHIAIYNDLRGPNNSLTHGDAAAHLAIGEAFQVIARGSADIMLSGATGTRVHPMRTVHAVLQEELAGNGVDPDKASRPFDLNRSGMVVGEGSATVILEELGHAQARGATILGEVVGSGSSCVAARNHVSRRAAALTNAIGAALRKAGWQPSEVEFVHAHGQSNRSSDREEAQALRHVFGDAADTLPVLAGKSYFGNLGAGSGAVELVMSLLALRHGQLFPVLNYETPDPECPVHCVREPQPAGQRFLNLSVNSRGQASCLLVQAFGE